MGQQSERTEEQMKKLEAEILKMQERSAYLKKRKQQQEQKEHEAWLKQYERLIISEFGSKYHILYTPQEAAEAFLKQEEAMPVTASLSGKIPEEATKEKEETEDWEENCE